MFTTKPTVIEVQGTQMHFISPKNLGCNLAELLTYEYKLTNFSLFIQVQVISTGRSSMCPQLFLTLKTHPVNANNYTKAISAKKNQPVYLMNS